MGSDLTEAMRIAGEMEFQFALPHGERPASRSVVGITPVVSIRAPAWGATHCVAAHYPQVEFQFALPHGERRLSGQAISTPLTFQFALPHGERRRFSGRSWVAPSFNSRSRMGSDVCHSIFPSPPRCFNSRSRMGSDCHHAMAGTACIESALFAS